VLILLLIVISCTPAKPVCDRHCLDPSYVEHRGLTDHFADISKDDLRSKLAELYKADKQSVSVFGLRTHFGGGKTTGFALIYDSVESLKKFEPHYRLVRYGEASKIEKASRQQRTLHLRRRISKCFRTADADRGFGQQANRGRTRPRKCEARRRLRALRRRINKCKIIARVGRLVEAEINIYSSLNL
jgi:small subunit ribosomal protein S24e